MIQNWIISDDTMTSKNYDGPKYDKKAGYPRMKNVMSALDVENMSFVRMKIKTNSPTNIMADIVPHGVVNNISG